MRTSKAHQAGRRGGIAHPSRAGTCGPLRCSRLLGGSGRLPALSPWKRPPRRHQKSPEGAKVPGATRGLLPQPTVPPAPTGHLPGCRPQLPGGRGEAPFPRTRPLRPPASTELPAQTPGRRLGCHPPPAAVPPQQVTRGGPGLLADRGGAPAAWLRPLPVRQPPLRPLPRSMRNRRLSAGGRRACVHACGYQERRRLATSRGSFFGSAGLCAGLSKRSAELSICLRVH